MPEEIEKEVKTVINSLEEILGSDFREIKFGPFSGKENSSITFTPEGCNFFRILLVTYKNKNYLMYPLCLHQKCYNSELDKKTSAKTLFGYFPIVPAEKNPIFREWFKPKEEHYIDDVMCSPDNCVFFKRIISGKHSKKNLDLLESDEFMSAEEFKFYIKFDSCWQAPPDDFAVFAGYKIITKEEADKIGD